MRVLKTFILPEDGYRLYKEGDTFPRTGFEPTPECIERLNGGEGREALISGEEKPKRKTKKGE